MKLSTKFIILGVIAVAASTGNGVVGAAARYKMSELDARQDIITTTLQRHLEADMQHDAVLGNVMSTLISSMMMNTAEAEAFRKGAREDVRLFEEHMRENLEQQNTPDDVKQHLAAAQRDMSNYNALALDIIGNTAPEELPVKLKRFRELYETLENSMGKVTESLHTHAKGIRGTYEQVKTMMLWVGTAISVIAVIIALILQAFVQIGVFRRQNQMVGAMQKIADGETDTDIPHTARNDEMGTMARTVQVFKDNALKVQGMARERQEQEQKAAAEKKQAMDKLAADFEHNVKNVVEMVASAATQMDASARNVSQIAQTSQKKLTLLTGEVNQASGNVETVASATSQLSQSITEINRQVTRATTITTSAVDEAKKADGTVQELVAAAQKIGEVVDMINSIAEQINLLALNATIEAARAGEAGKGFAVVASEVKTLATETTKATSEISAYIGSIQSTTNETVTVIQTISSTIREINEISTAIAAAVEEQGVATQDIAQNVQQAAHSTREATQEVVNVSQSAEQTGQAANEMTTATSELNKQSTTLRREVEKFLGEVRGAA